MCRIIPQVAFQLSVFPAVHKSSPFPTPSVAVTEYCSPITSRSLPSKAYGGLTLSHAL